MVAGWIGTEKSATVLAQAWEDDEHVLVVAHQGVNRWAIVRLGLDGSMEYAVEPVEGDEVESPFRLASR